MKIVMLLTVLLFGGLAYAQVGNSFPLLRGETVDEKPLELPLAGKGKYTIIGIASSRDAEADLLSWAGPVYRKFIADVKSDIWDETYDVNVFFVPVFTGINKAALGPARKQVLAKADPEWFPHLMFYRTDDLSFQDQLMITDPRKPYIFILDPEGRIVYASSGGCTDRKIGDIEDILDL